MQQTIYALLVGINHYASPTVPDLGGCVNDVEEMANLLQSHFGQSSANIVTLLNDQATYDAVKSQFRQHLIESARIFVEHGRAEGQPQPPPAILFHFSGHGSQAPDPTGEEPDGLDETLVCHDSRLPNIYDLKDWELGALLDEVAQYSDNITVMLDCCHAGSGTRSETKLVANTRSCFPDLREQPSARPLVTSKPSPLSTTDLSATDTSEVPRRVTRSGMASGRAAPHWARGRSNHVLIAACRDQEKAHEYIPAVTTTPGEITSAMPSAMPSEITSESTEQRRHGVMTHYLIPLLKQLDPNHLPTYRELYEQLRRQVTGAYPQTPQCEGDWGRLIFGGVRPNRDLWLMVLDIEQAQLLGNGQARYWINGGLAHGLAMGTRLYAYPPTARTLDEAGDLLGTLEVVEVGAVRSACKVVKQRAAIPVHARLALVESVSSSSRRTVAIDISSGMIAAAVRDRLAQDDLAGLVALLPAGSDAALRVVLVNDAIEVQEGNGRPLGKAYPLRELNRMRRPLRAADLDPIALDLQRIVRAKRLDLLQNADSDLADALVLTIKHLTINPTTGDPEIGAVIAEIAPNAPASDQLATVQHGVPFVVEITNRSDEPLYVGLLLRSGVWRVEQVYPEVRGAQEQLFPGRTLTLGFYNNPARQLRLLIDDATASEEATFLLIGTVAEADFELFLQQEEALAAADQARHEGYSVPQRIMRSFKLGMMTTAADEWMSLQLTVRVAAD